MYDAACKLIRQQQTGRRGSKGGRIKHRHVKIRIVLSAKRAITFQNTKSYKVKQKLHVHPYEDIKKRKAMIRRLPRVSRDKRETKDNLIHCFRAKVAITFQNTKSYE